LPNIDTNPDAVSTGNGIQATATTPAENDSLVHIENVVGGIGNDTITGNSAANSLNGGPGSDKISGGDGNDQIRGGGSDGNSDLLHGDAGNDTFWWEPGYDLVSGGPGADAMWYALSASPIVVSEDNIANDGTFINGVSEKDNIADDVEIIIGGTSTNTIDAPDTSNTNNIFWTPFSSSRNQLQGGGGNDILIGGSGPDLLEGGPGNDSLQGGDGDDGLYGDARCCTVDARGVEVLSNGGYGNNILDGGNGNDVLGGANGLVDTITCGAGTDVVLYDLVIKDTYKLVSQGGDCEGTHQNGAP
jgi:Ca2+-binding RTX toxin-like protein